MRVFHWDEDQPSKLYQVGSNPIARSNFKA